MGPVGAALELRMELDAHMEGTLRQLYRFNQALVRGGSAEGAAVAEEAVEEVTTTTEAVAE